MLPEFMCDAFDDLADSQPLPPVVRDVPRGFIPNLIQAGAIMGADLDFLAVVAPDLHMLRVAYQPVEGSRNALRHALHQTGVLR